MYLGGKCYFEIMKEVEIKVDDVLISFGDFEISPQTFLTR